MLEQIKGNKWIKGGIALVILTIIQNILDRIVNFSSKLLLPTILNISFSEIILIIGLMLLVIILVIILLKANSDVEMIDKVQAFLFFPNGTPNNNRTLDYHKNNLHNKLIVNFKTNPPKAYILTRDNSSYGWRMINKYPNKWVSILHPNSESKTFVDKWCKQKGYILITYDASKKDLLEEG